MNWTLIIILGGLAVLMTFLMRPDIFLSVLRGNKDKPVAKVYRAKTDKEFQASLQSPPLTPEVKTSEKREEHHG
jgi:hypothetical protein